MKGLVLYLLTGVDVEMIERKLRGVMRENALLREENADLRAENAALRSTLLETKQAQNRQVWS